MNNVPVRKGLNEYSYHVSCGPCGEHGTEFNEFLIANYDDYMVPVKLHYEGLSTPAWMYLNCPESREIDSAIDGISHPQMMFNRSSLMPYENGMTYYPYPGFCPTDSNWIIRDINFFNKVPVEFSFSNVSLNNTTNTFSFKLNTTFTDAMSFSSDTRVSCMLVEDSIWYYQASNGTHPIDSEYHRFVLRKIYGGPWGAPSSIPSSVAANQTISISFSDTLKPVYNKSRLYLVPIIQSFTSSYTTREILNTRRFKLSSLPAPTFVNEIDKGMEFELYPNPSNDITLLKSKGITRIKSYRIYSIEAKEMYQSRNLNKVDDQTYSIQTTNLVSGTYLVNVKFENGTNSIQKLVVSH